MFGVLNLNSVSKDIVSNFFLIMQNIDDQLVISMVYTSACVLRVFIKKHQGDDRRRYAAERSSSLLCSESSLYYSCIPIFTTIFSTENL